MVGGGGGGGGGRWDFRFLVRFFGFDVLCGLRDFFYLAFGFLFLPAMMAVFSIFLSNAISGFSRFAKDITSRNRAKTVIIRNHLQLEECITSLVSLKIVIMIWVVTNAKHTMKS